MSTWQSVLEHRPKKNTKNIKQKRKETSGRTWIVLSFGFWKVHIFGCVRKDYLVAWARSLIGVSYKAKILKPPSSSLSLLHFQVHTFLSRTFWLFLAKPSIFHWKDGFFVLMLVNFSPYQKLWAIWVKRVCSKLVFEWQSNPTRCWLSNTCSQTLLFHTHLCFWGFALANWYVRHSL